MRVESCLSDNITVTKKGDFTVLVSFREQMFNAWQKNNSLLCVGLDPDINRFPEFLKKQNDSIYLFCKEIIDATADLVCAFKPQIAYFHGEQAEEQLQKICEYIKKNYPHIPIVLDAKRGDIGATAKQYAREAFERYKADAVTLSPYMGFDSIEPYIKQFPNKGLIILTRTSNPGGSDLQFLPVKTPSGEMLLYQYVAKLVATKWDVNQQCGFVVGATYPDEIAQVRALVGDRVLLVPGIGAQGGDIKSTVLAGKDSQNMGMMINSSRAILYAGIDKNESFAQVSRQVAIATRDEINRYR